VPEGSGEFSGPFAALVPHVSKPNENVTFSVVPANGVDAPIFAVTPRIGRDGILAFSLKPLAMARFNGQLLYNVTASNDGGTAFGARDTSAVRQFSITISFVNQPPSFELAEYLDPLLENSGEHSFPAFAFDISTGDPESEGQSVSFALTLSSPSTALFTTPPAIDNNGTLSFSLAANQFGVARYTVSLSDSGAGTNAAEVSYLPSYILLATYQVSYPPVSYSPS